MSQDGCTLAFCTRLFVHGNIIQNLPATGLEDDYDILGKYESKERAIEVLNEIQQQINMCVEDTARSYNGQISRYIIFNMPKE